MSKNGSCFADSLRKMSAEAPDRQKRNAEADAETLVTMMYDRCRDAATKEAERGANMAFARVDPPMVSLGLVPEETMLKRVVKRLKADGLEVTWEKRCKYDGGVQTNIPEICFSISW